MEERGIAPYGPAVLLIAATIIQASFASIQQGVPVIAVFVRQAMHLSLAQMGAIVSAVYLGRIIGTLTTGPIVDRVGPRRLQGWGTALTVVVILVMVELTSYVGLLIGLFFLGIILATGSSSGTRSIFEVFPSERRGFAIGIRQASVPVGGAIGAALIPGFLEGVGLATVWVGMAAMVAVTGTLFTLAAPTWGPGRVTKGIIGSLGAFRTAVVPWLVAFLLASGQAATLGFVIVDLNGRYGWPLALAGGGLAVALVGGGVGRLGAGWLSDRFHDSRHQAITAIGLTGASMALLMAWLPAKTPVAALGVVLFFLGLGGLGWNSAALTWAGERVPEAHAGQAMSWTSAAISLGVVIDPPVLGWLVDVTHNYGEAWTAVAVTMAAAVALGLLTGRRGRPEALRAAGDGA